MYGTVSVRSEAGADTSVSPLVVFLEPIGESNLADSRHRSVFLISAADRFNPPFMVLSAGDTAIFVNQGGLKHRLFSPDLTADLGSDVVIPLSPAGEYASVDFLAYGTKRLYCSLHPEEVVSVFVSPTPFYAMPDSAGGFVIRDVPDGRYRLAIWSEVVSGLVRRVRVDASQSGIQNVQLDLSRTGR